MTAVASSGAGHRTGLSYPAFKITNRSRRVYMGPASSPRERSAMPANGSQVHEFVPPGPPPRRGIRTRLGYRLDPHPGPRNDPPAAWRDPGEGPQEGSGAALGEG